LKKQPSGWKVELVTFPFPDRRTAMSSVANEATVTKGADGAAVTSLPLVQVDEARIHEHLDGVVRRTVEETLNALLDAEADELCGAKRYQRSPDRVDTRAGHYARRLHTKATVTLYACPKADGTCSDIHPGSLGGCNP
jgi:hypothetical protein